VLTQLVYFYVLISVNNFRQVSTILEVKINSAEFSVQASSYWVACVYRKQLVCVIYVVLCGAELSKN